jgi:hypothetical protein
MKSILLSRTVILTVFSILAVLDAKEFKQIQQWKHRDRELWRISFATIDKDNHLVADFGCKLGWRVISHSIKAFGPGAPRDFPWF